MADYLPQATGNWSTTTWITAVSNLTAFAGGNLPPTTVDDVYADGKTVTIDINTAVRSIRTTTTPRTGGLAGGGFTLSNSITLSANCLAGTTTCLTFGGVSPNTATLVGNVTGSATVNNAFGVNNNSTGTLTISGDARGNTFGGGANNNSTGTLTIFGNCIGGGGGAQNFVFGVKNAIGGGVLNIIGNVIGSPLAGSGHCGAQCDVAPATINVTGNVIGSSTNPSGAFGIRNVVTGTVINIIGNVIGVASEGLNTNSPCVISVSGNAIGSTGSGIFGIRTTGVSTITVVGTVSGGTGAGASGISNESTGFVYATKAVGNGFGLGSVGIGGVAVGLANSQNGRAYVEQVEFGSRGATPISGPVYILPSNRNTLTGYTTAAGTPVTFYNSLSVNGLLPPVSSVQAGVVYNVGNSVGTMAVPSASAVQFGVAVDNTTGTAALQPQDIWGYARLSATQVNSMGDRLRNAATTQSIGYQIASFNL